jgi:16S rRNA processing protein RimM
VGHSILSDGLPFGALGRPHGNTGEITFRPYHSRGWRLDTAALPLEAVIGEPGSEISVTVTAVRPVVDGFLLRLGGVSTREGAASLTGRQLWLFRTTLPRLGADEFYVEDLIGCLVEDREGRSLGVVRDVFWNGGHDVMVVGVGEEAERLLPAVPEYIVAIDRSAKRVVVDPHE